MASNNTVVLFQVRRGRATAGQSRDVSEYVTAHGVTAYTVTDGSNPSTIIPALFEHPFDGSVLFVERVGEESIAVLKAVAERLGHTVAAFAVAAQPRKRLPLVAVGSETQSETEGQSEPMLAHG
jgi:hypothetical protein